MSHILVGQGVCKHFGGLKAVDEVDFHLDEGEILGLIGPNGAGKTTLFSVAAGSIPATRGTVWLQGERVSGRSAHRSVHLGITRTHQIVRPFARLTVLENLLVGHYYGRPQGVTGVADDRAIARALATGPKVLLLDEVVAGLNLVESRRVVQLIRQIRERGLSIIVIEHVMHALMSLSDRVMVLDHGHKIAEGKPEEVANDPAVVEAYLGREEDGGASAGTAGQNLAEEG